MFLIDAETVTRVNGTAVAEPITAPSLHDLQIYGIIVTIILCFIVFGGVKMINRVAPAFLIPVLFSLVCIFLGILLARKDKPAGFYYFCLLFFLFSFHFCLRIMSRLMFAAFSKLYNSSKRGLKLLCLP